MKFTGASGRMDPSNELTGVIPPVRPDGTRREIPLVDPTGPARYSNSCIADGEVASNAWSSIRESRSSLERTS